MSMEKDIYRLRLFSVLEIASAERKSPLISNTIGGQELMVDLHCVVETKVSLVCGKKIDDSRRVLNVSVENVATILDHGFNIHPIVWEKMLLEVRLNRRFPLNTLFGI